MRCASRRSAGSRGLVLAALLVATPVPCPAAEPAASPAANGAPAEASPSGSRREERKPPTDVILCRGPRGAVYARDASEGCRYSRLTPENLVDFGVGADCLLRRATPPAEGEAKQELRDCDDVCGTLADGRSCVVAVRRGAGGTWETFTPEKQFSPGDPALREAIAVCCKR
jgi:hypothetical protein